MTVVPCLHALWWQTPTTPCVLLQPCLGSAQQAVYVLPQRQVGGGGVRWKV